MTEDEWQIERSKIAKAVEKAMWANDQDTLWKIAPCDCCCHEHTLSGCLARLWEGCRGQGSMTRADYEGWAKHYGMTVDEFLDWGR